MTHMLYCGVTGLIRLFDTMPNRRHRSFDVNGNWVRWSQYHLVNGVVGPAPRATPLPYDPWASFRTNAGKYRTVSQPYLALLELRRRLKEEEARGISPTQLQGRDTRGLIVGSPTAADQLILDWCTEHALLGILPVMATCIRLDDVDDRHELAIKRTYYIRDGKRWNLGTTQQFEWLSTREATEERLREMVKKAKGTVTWLNFGTRAHDELPLEELRDFFPKLENAGGGFVPPLPLTDEFWQAYGEPVWEIKKYCHLFGEAVDYMKLWNAKRSADQQDSSVRRASMFLRDLAQNVPLDDLDGTRTSAGLLASYALMFLWDRREGRRCLQCENCARYLVSNETRARYCSPRCRNIVQSRRHRAKNAGRQQSKSTL